MSNLQNSSIFYVNNKLLKSFQGTGVTTGFKGESVTDFPKFYMGPMVKCLLGQQLHAARLFQLSYPFLLRLARTAAAPS
ncbi:hypothetical protein Y1Q_0017937 [Alligator mississippiensis]|uniref:Uncharacterized protein n=1 Tax=Alligator mississippiensis TaxID=8496 RepID=A0A151MXW5_ALLMI|nr:hypothetical protein Y1Q_0017937 [Alligator mississippiensis]